MERKPFQEHDKITRLEILQRTSIKQNAMQLRLLRKLEEKQTTHELDDERRFTKLEQFRAYATKAIIGLFAAVGVHWTIK